jgi:hypothetical protein
VPTVCLSVPPAHSGLIAVSRDLSVHPDLHAEVPEPEDERAPAAQVHYPGKQDNYQDDQDNPNKSDHEARYREAAQFSHGCNDSRLAGMPRRSALMQSSIVDRAGWAGEALNSPA